MTSIWIYTAQMFVTDPAAGGQFLAAALNDPNQLPTFASEHAPGWWGANGVARQGEADMLASPLNSLPIVYFLVRRSDGALVATNHEQSAGRVGDPWDWEDSVAALGGPLPPPPDEEA